MRLISLCPSLTETVFELGCAALLVGRTRYCVEPADQVDAIETLGGTKDPDLARIIKLAPDLVLLNQEENRVEDHEALLEAGLNCHVSYPRTPHDVPALLRDLGSVLGATQPGAQLASELEAQLASLPDAGPAPVSFIYLVWRKPWMAAGADTFASALLETAGGRNAIQGSSADRYPSLTPDLITQAAPALVLLSSEPFPFEASHARELARATGLPLERFLQVDGQLLSWHGARTLAGLPYAAGVLVRKA